MSNETKNVETIKTTIKIGTWILKIFKPIKDRWPKLSIAIGALLAAIVALGSWAANDFSAAYAMDVFNAIKEFFTSAQNVAP